MSDAPTNPNDPRPRVNKEFEDPHYHDDDDPDLYSEDGPRESRDFMKKKRPNKMPTLRRWHIED